MIILVSGGLDSYIACRYLEEDNSGYILKALFIDYHGKYTKKEKAVCERLYPKLLVDDTLNFNNIESGKKAFIKNRNAYFALIASNYGERIVMGGLKDDNVGDKSPESFLAMERLLNTIDTKNQYSVISPFWRKTKSDIIKWYLEYGFDVEDLLQTTSCYHPTEHFCGKCPSCFRKWCAFSDNNIAHYLPTFKNKELVETYLNNIKSYDLQRQQSIKDAAKKMGAM